MPLYLTAHPPHDASEERQVRKLAHSLHAPADWVFHAKMVVYSWKGQRIRQIAQALSCHPQTVRDRLHAFTPCLQRAGPEGSSASGASPG